MERLAGPNYRERAFERDIEEKDWKHEQNDNQSETEAQAVKCQTSTGSKTIVNTKWRFTFAFQRHRWHRFGLETVWAAWRWYSSCQ